MGELIELALSLPPKLARTACQYGQAGKHAAGPPGGSGHVVLKGLISGFISTIISGS